MTKQCKRGHPLTLETQYKDGRCKQCCKEDRRLWYIKHREEQNKRSRKWHQENRERHSSLTKRWYLENRELHLQRSRQWATNNPSLKANSRRVRRAIIKNAPGIATYEQVMNRMEYHGFKCRYCDGPFEEVDHMIPISKGGSNWPANLVPSCRPCNRSKSTKTSLEFLGEKEKS